MNDIKKLLITTSLLLGFALPGIAQITVSGIVTDASDGQPLPGVNIIVQNAPSVGTSSRADGAYSLSVPSETDTLIFSFVGYIKQEVPIDGRSTIDIALSSDIQALDDVVVIGYGTQDVDDNTGSVTAVNADDFNEGAITSPEELFQGKTAGVNVTSNDGAPGSGATIRIRGGSSLSASNDPLFVVDGVPLDGSGVSGMRSPLNTINPNDIASITVLKDASATAIYGSRASNGVIIIETKKGTVGQELKVNYTGKFSVQTNRNQVDVLSADQFRNVIREQFGEDGSQYLGEASTNWQNKIYKQSLSQDHNLSFTGAVNQLPYRLSLGYSGNNGILKTSQLDRLTGSLALTPTFLDDRLKIDLNLKGMQVNNQFANQAAIGSAVVFDPTKPVKVEGENRFDGYYTWVDADGSPISIAPSNPVALLNQTNDESTVYRSIGNVKFDYTTSFLPELSATLNLGYDYSDVGDGLYTVPETAAFEYSGANEANGVRRDYSQKKENELLDFYLNYNDDLSSIDSKVDLTAGYSWEHHYSRGSEYATNFDRSSTLVVDQDTDYETEHYIISFFGRMNYTFKDKYLLTATLRQDGTSRFSEDNRWGLFPSAALAWKMHKEPFLKGIDDISQLKLRLGYGVTGQQRIGQGDYPYLGRYTYGEPTASYQFGDTFLETLRPEGYNANLKWEETTTYNLGLDYGFLNDRIYGSVETYYRETTDLLNVVPVPAGTNFTNRILSNVGTLEVKGVEFNITGRPISTDNTFWEVGFNLSHNTNEITKLTTADDPDYIGVETGGIAGGTGNTIQIHSVGHPRSSFYVHEQVYDQDGNPIEGLYVDRNDDGVVDEDDKYRYQNPDADVTLGLSSRLEYKNWDASFSARASLGNYIYNNVASSNSFYSDMLYTQYIRNTPTSIFDTDFNTEQFHSDHYVENASFLRMDNITLGYTFSDVLTAVSSLRLSATVQNAFVITNYSGLDPEVFGGIDNNLYPRPRTFMLGVNLNF
ncbi:SusC/RagA family TonB-linked outer membrane protein [Fodinibius salsisoli]|uniref:TonB-dependent receptor n=1 Tax=Fodinibius salsisoli TaxID=2820877 RepID=A0ABT3PTF6_9BACT|nr:TonB-dependent receptor [Fodinibius salsisoli]MCW9709109.1 TonB-dependent receptor [Fodinibius salsisoli]